MTFFKNNPFLLVLKIFEKPMKECYWNTLRCLDGDYSK